MGSARRGAAREQHRGPGLPPAVPRGVPGVPRGAPGRAVPRLPCPDDEEPAARPGLQAAGLPRGRGQGADALRVSVRRVPGPLRAGARSAGRPEDRIRGGRAVGARAGLLHPHDLRVPEPGAGGPERRGRRRPLRRPGRGAGRTAHAVHRIRHRRGADPHLPGRPSRSGRDAAHHRRVRGDGGTGGSAGGHGADPDAATEGAAVRAGSGGAQPEGADAAGEQGSVPVFADPGRRRAGPGPGHAEGHDRRGAAGDCTLPRRPIGWRTCRNGRSRR